jgi:uncharacterized protein (TIGR02646 family)
VRFIDLELLDRTIPGLQGVLDDLEAARVEVIAEDDPKKRKALVERHSTRWTAMREYLAELSYNKCWYVECRNPGTDDDIDHFRPKLRVDEARDHPGYYWLAFDWHNLRLSCHRSNRLRRNLAAGETGGKADHFPLIEPARRAYKPEDDLDEEEPEILDPTNPADPPLITFIQNGEAQLSPRYKGVAVAERRFECTRLLLHLNWPEFNEDRTRLYNRIERLVDRGRRELRKCGPGSPVPHAFKDVIRDLRGLMRPDSDYSTAAAEYVQLFKHEWWIEDIVLRQPW